MKRYTGRSWFTARRERASEMIKLFTDTAANLPAEIISKYDIGVIPLQFTVNGVPVSYDGFNGKAFYDGMRRGDVVRTSMINTVTYMNHFRPVLERENDVLYVGMSGGISSTAASAAVAARELSAEFPENRIVTIDTLAASLGEGLQVIDAAVMINDGLPLDDIADALYEKRDRMCQYFTVDDLRYLVRGGRLTGPGASLVAKAGAVLKIKPVLVGDDAGRIIVKERKIGRNNSLRSLADNYDRLVSDRRGPVGIAHADDPVGAQILIDALRDRGCESDIMTVVYEPVTGSYVGPGAVALFFPGIFK